MSNRKIKIHKDPYGTGINLFSKDEITISTGINTLIGCNGSGKTTLLKSIEEYLKKEKIKYFKYSNYKDGGSNASSFYSFEGDTLMTDTMTAEVAISRMNEPTEWMEGTIFSCQINFYNNEDKEQEDETSFDIDCTHPNWRDELLALWNDFRKENNLPENCVTDAWATVVDEDYFLENCYD